MLYKDIHMWEGREVLSPLPLWAIFTFKYLSKKAKLAEPLPFLEAKLPICPSPLEGVVFTCLMLYREDIKHKRTLEVDPLAYMEPV